MESKEIVKIVIDELVDRGLIKKNVNTFERTRDLLRNFKRIENSLKGIDDHIRKLNKEYESLTGLKPKDLKAYNYDSKPSQPMEYESINIRIKELESSKVKIRLFLDYVKSIIKEILPSEEDDLINIIYIQGSKTVKEYCSDNNLDKTATYRKINKIINKINVELFPDQFIDELYS